MCGREKLEGHVFGDFTAMEYIGGKKYRMVCNCCGEVKELYGTNIKKNIGVTCKNKKKEVVNLEGQYIGEWYVDKYVGNKRYRCICSCGKIVDVLKVNLMNGSSTSCGHSKNSYGNLMNQKFGEWTVIGKSGYKWKCRCSCGKIGYCMAADLVKGKTKSCGHDYFINPNDIIDKKFGHWTVKEYVGNRMYHCVCDCSNKTERDISRYDLIDGKSTSCGCAKALEYKKRLYERYGETAPNRASSPRENNQLIAIKNKDNLTKFIKDLGYKPTSLELAHELGLKLHRTLVIVHAFGLEELVDIGSKESYAERQLYRYICSFYNGTVERRNRQVLNGKELDIYIPDKKLAIEFNGDYWHSTIFKDKKYHQDKTIACAKQGIRLIHIFEHEYLHNEEKLKTFIKGVLTDGKKVIYARNTEVKEIDSKTAQEFCEYYHLQGWSNSKICIGCYYNDELVSVMTFAKPRFDNNIEYEIIRYCVKDNVSIVGGANKLFKYFTDTYKPASVITYSDISKFTGNIYLKLGFKVDKITSPNYVWVSEDLKAVLNRYQTQKHKLVEHSLGTENQTEEEIMYDLGFFKVYDSGNIKLIWNKEA